jgi:hypothetical protein
MIKPELYQRTIDILVDAYFNDTLKHGSCAACAVGNIISATNGIEIGKGTEGEPVWVGAETSWYVELCVPTYVDAISESVKVQVVNTGYSILDLVKIEDAFEAAEYTTDADTWMFDGLMNVIDVLDEIHQNKDTVTTSDAKKRFRKAVA